MVALEEQQVSLGDCNEMAGDSTDNLVEMWICISDECNTQNNNCYIACNGKHYRVNATQPEVWTSAVTGRRDDATLDPRPRDMSRILLERQGLVGENLGALTLRPQGVEG